MTSHQIKILESHHHSNFNGHMSSASALHQQTIDDTRSFIQERIERLYGPGALAAGYTRRSTGGSSSSSNITMGNSVKKRNSPQERIIPIQLEYSNDEVDRHENGKGMPSVFRHLRPEFRHQLPVKSPVKSEPQSPSDSTTKDLVEKREEQRSIDVTLGKDVANDSQVPTNGSAGINGNYKIKQNGCGSSTMNGGSNKVAPSVIEEKSSVAPAPQPSVIEKLEEKLVVASDSQNKESDGAGSSKSLTPADPSVKDGHYFLKVVEETVNGLESEVAVLEAEFEKHSATMTEELRGKVLACTGKAKLLISQKIKQFAGLCHKNITGEKTDDFPTTCGDLQGFWDMVSLQVDDINRMLEALKVVKANNWVEVAPVAAPVPKSATAGRSARKVRPAMSAAEKEKDAARKKAAEERRKAMRQAMKAKRAAAASSAADEDKVEIFVPEK